MGVSESESVSIDFELNMLVNYVLLVTLFSEFLFCYVQPGLVYCMDYLEKNIDWLQSKLEPLVQGRYTMPNLFNMLYK